jgi:hypothetical protein
MRAEIKDKAMDLRDRTTDGVKDTVSQVVSAPVISGVASRTSLRT